MSVPWHTPVRAELPANTSIDLAFGKADRVRGVQDDRATPLDPTPYRASTTVFSVLSMTTIAPWMGVHANGGLSRPFELGFSFLPVGSGGSAFRWLIATDVGMYLTPVSIEAKYIQGPQKVRKGILSAWSWNILTALGYRITPWWLVSAGIRRQAFDIHTRFKTGIDDEWNLGGDNVTYFVDQGFNFGPWRGDLSLFKSGRRFAANERVSDLGFAISGGVGW